MKVKRGIKKRSAYSKKNILAKEKISDQKLLAQYYSMADVFVICSKRENFPTTCVEAQCCGTAVAGFDTGGTKETAIHGTDFFVEYGDVEMLREKVKELLDHPVDVGFIAAAAGKVYAKQSMYNKYEQLYHRVLNGEKM